ncbi:hypothetical protein V6N11_022149 [Hibiscus sabdariffa]|uniref:Uncharacterized protein n=1 Tax=Hibiscus sabdariffa TaxID=183260 RepID=A0ABR2TIB3_9ROSI
MSDWGPVFVAVMLFLLLTPGLLIQIPGRLKYVEFGNFQTSGVSILVHSIIYFALMCIFLIAIGVHIKTTRAKLLSSKFYFMGAENSIVQNGNIILWGGFCFQTGRIIPGDRNANSAEAMKGAAQSFISVYAAAPPHSNLLWS